MFHRVETGVLPRKICVCSLRFLNRQMPNQGKPPILPPSKTRLYRVSQGKWQDPESVQELLWRRHTYNNAMISMRQVFKDELNEKHALGEGLDEIRRLEQEELTRLIAENNRRNELRAIERAELEKVEMDQMREQTLKEIENALNINEEMVKENSKKVLAHIEASKEFITKENMEAKIREALENPICHDYAITLDGTQIHSSTPVKYLEGIPTRQKGRFYDLREYKEKKVATESS